MTEQHNGRAQRRLKQLTMEDKRKLAEGSEKFILTNESATLEAAKILFVMSRQKLLATEALKLKMIRQNKVAPQPLLAAEEEKAEGGTINDCGAFNIPNELPPFGYSIDGTKLPRFPPLETLHSIIDREMCSYPFEKQVTWTDVNRGHNRLLFPIENVKIAILPLLKSLNRENDLEVGIPVTTYDSRGNEYSMEFKGWAKQRIYVLKTRWHEFVERNNLVEVENWISVWVFRRKETGMLCFALNVKHFPAKALMNKKRSKKEPSN